MQKKKKKVRHIILCQHIVCRVDVWAAAYHRSVSAADSTCRLIEAVAVADLILSPGKYEMSLLSRWDAPTAVHTESDKNNCVKWRRSSNAVCSPFSAYEWSSCLWLEEVLVKVWWMLGCVCTFYILKRVLFVWCSQSSDSDCLSFGAAADHLFAASGVSVWTQMVWLCHSSSTDLGSALCRLHSAPCLSFTLLLFSGTAALCLISFPLASLHSLSFLWPPTTTTLSICLSSAASSPPQSPTSLSTHPSPPHHALSNNTF